VGGDGMTITEKIMQTIANGNQWSATRIAYEVDAQLTSVASKLTALHKAGTIRAESIWIQGSKKPVLFYFKETK